jgi:hypothetical protein
MVVGELDVDPGEAQVRRRREAVEEGVLVQHEADVDRKARHSVPSSSPDPAGGG